MTYIEKLRARWLDTNSLLCVGLDPNPARFPAPLMGADNALYDFCIGIVEATAPWVCAFKPQIAYFASMAGEEALQASLDQDQILIEVDLHTGQACGRAWGCDLTYKYVQINASYRS